MKNNGNRNHRSATCRRTPATGEFVPYVMRLPGHRMLFVEIPARYVEYDRSGELLFKPEAVRLLDRVRATAMSASPQSTPGHIAALRDALDMTQEELAAELGVSKMTVSRWERGKIRPSRGSIAAIERLRKKAARRGVTISS